MPLRSATQGISTQAFSGRFLILPPVFNTLPANLKAVSIASMMFGQYSRVGPEFRRGFIEGGKQRSFSVEIDHRFSMNPRIPPPEALAADKNPLKAPRVNRGP